jgi:hypothetical protein
MTHISYANFARDICVTYAPDSHPMRVSSTARHERGLRHCRLRGETEIGWLNQAKMEESGSLNIWNLSPFFSDLYRKINRNCSIFNPGNYCTDDKLDGSNVVRCMLSCDQDECNSAVNITTSSYWVIFLSTICAVLVNNRGYRWWQLRGWAHYKFCFRSSVNYMSLFEFEYCIGRQYSRILWVWKGIT